MDETVMDTTFKDAGGNRVGFIIGNDVKDSGGNRIGLIIGVIVMIIIIASGGNDFLNNAFVGLFATLLLGTVGGIIGAIVNFIKKLTSKNK